MPAINWTKKWSSADDGTVVSGTDLKNIQDDVQSGLVSDTTISVATGTFNNSDLSSGVLTITHGFGSVAPYPINITVFDNDSELIWPDTLTGFTNTVELDMTSYGTLSGTWGYSYVIGG
jgi:hypothetical protein